MSTRPQCTLVGLMGRAGAGKSTAERYLQAAHGFQPSAFADPIKAMLEALCAHTGADWAHLHEPSLKQAPIPELGGLCARRLMTSLGDWGRQHSDYFWINAAQRALGLPDAPVAPLLVISDVRYPNEAGWVRAMGGRIWLIERDNLPQVASHPSEYAHHSIQPDLRLPNNGAVDELYLLLDNAVDALQAQHAQRPLDATPELAA
jgi:hypothetical protein